MNFSYKARTKEGRIQKGILEATNRKAALDVLEKYGLFVTLLKESTRKPFFSKAIGFGKIVSQKDLVIFTRQLSTMFKSAIPPLEALRAQVVQTDNPRFREKVLRMAEAIERGSSLSQAFAMFPKIFNTFYVSIIKSGEATGKVADSLVYLADHLERDYNFNQKVKGAMLYPIFVIIVFFGAGLIAIFFIVPKLTEILKGFGEDLPILTRMLMWFAGFISKGGWIVVLGLIIPAPILFFIIRRMPEAKRGWHKISLKLPLLGDFYRKLYLTRFAENLSVLITAGLPITQALKITKDIITNTVYKGILADAELKVSRGEKISSVLTKHGQYFPAFVTQMISTGEETGRLDKTLMEMVRFYRQEIERATERLTTLLEPILIIVLGAAVAFLAFAIFVPLFNIGLGSGM